MTSIFKGGIVVAAAILLGAAGTAQAGMEQVVKANVPFAFVVNVRLSDVPRVPVALRDFTR